jgi:hypothetical protein
MNGWRVILLALGGVATAVLVTGCEVESASVNKINVSPSSAILRPDEAVTLTASGGFDYKWALTGDATLGTLSTTKGPTTTYTSTHDPGSDTVVQTVQLTSFINGQDTSGTTNGTGSVYEQTAEVTITQIGYLLVTPATATVTNQYATVEFTAQGGKGGYTWSLAKPSLGVLTATSGKTTTYTATAAPGVQTVLQTLTLRSNADGAEAKVTIVHAGTG